MCTPDPSGIFDTNSYSGTGDEVAGRSWKRNLCSLASFLLMMAGGAIAPP
jgi:hypothetical protein